MKKKIAISLILITEIIIFYLEKNYFGSSFSVDRFLILSIISCFFYIHFILDLNKMYNFVYKKRYFLGLLFLIIVTILGYHGSSISAWNDIIQPNYNINNGGLLIGIPRLIRGDEYIVSTPMMLSQVSNNFSSISNTLMGHSSLVTLFPSLPCKNITIFTNLFNIIFLLLPFKNAFAFYWYGRLLMIFFGSFELSMLITKKNKLYSLLGAMLITLSPVCSWWSIMPILGYGAIAILILNLFLKEKIILLKIIYTILFSIIGASYIMLLYPAWQVPFGYVYLCFVIWIIFKNKENLSIKQLIYLFISIVLMALTIYLIFKDSYNIYLLTTSTVYPGNRFTNGGYGYINLFNYMINIFFPCIPFSNPCEYSNFISLYPLPIIMSFIYTIKNNKKDLLTILLVIISILLSLWNYIPLNNGLVKLSLLSFSVPERTYIVVGYICVFLLIRNMALNEKFSNKHNKIYLFISCLISVAITISLKKNYSDFLNNIYMLIIMNIIFIPIFYLLLLNTKKGNKILSISLIILSLFVGGTINPISKGIEVLTEKPFAKEIQKIVKNNQEKKWISISDNYAIANYLVANGASTINSTNYYPNFELWYSLDENKEYEDVYNRYAHILIELVDSDTKFELVTQDTFKVFLNILDIKKLNINYIVSQTDITESVNDKIDIKNIYTDDGIYIYEINYKE